MATGEAPLPPPGGAEEPPRPAGHSGLRGHRRGTRRGTRRPRREPQRPSPPSLPADDDVGVVLQALVQLLVTHAWGRRAEAVSGVPSRSAGGWLGSPAPPPAARPWRPSSAQNLAQGPSSTLSEGSRRGGGEPEPSARSWAHRQPPASHQPETRAAQRAPHRSCSRSRRSCGSLCTAGLDGSAHPARP